MRSLAIVESTRELLEWLAVRPRTDAETTEAWESRCPRLTVWEDAIAAALLRVDLPDVRLSAAADAVLTASAPAR